MRAEKRFSSQPKSFWANVRYISQEVGYTVKRKSIIRIPTLESVMAVYGIAGLRIDHLVSSAGKRTDMGRAVFDYFEFRAAVLNEQVQHSLMSAEEAKGEFESLHRLHSPRCPLPMNKQKAAMKAPAFLTGIVNILIEAHAEGLPCDYDPRRLTMFTHDGELVRTLARRVDGAFPAPINPIALWEIKEYYYTTTVGSRVADGVYESLLDGMELEEILATEKVPCEHLLMVDGKFTWWDCGRSYLCRMIDILHMGYVDEVLFGREVIERLPAIVTGWVKGTRKTHAGDPKR